MDATHRPFGCFMQSLHAPALQAVAAHWNEARGPEQMPSWEQLKPSRMAAQLSILWSYRYDPTSGQFVGRLAGNGVDWGFGKNFRGTPLPELMPAEVAENAHKAMLRVISEPAIYRVQGGLFKQAGRVIEGERIALPLASDGIHGDGVLGASFYDHMARTRQAGDTELLPGDKKWYALS